MSWEAVPEAEMPRVLSAVQDGRCCVCYGAIAPEHGGGFYCCAHDDMCQPECGGAA